jgi:hypothetical protein
MYIFVVEKDDAVHEKPFVSIIMNRQAYTKKEAPQGGALIPFPGESTPSHAGALARMTITPFRCIHL